PVVKHIAGEPADNGAVLVPEKETIVAVIAPPGAVPLRRRPGWRSRPRCRPRWAHRQIRGAPWSRLGSADTGGDFDLDLHAFLDHLHDQHGGGRTDILKDRADSGDDVIHQRSVA